MNRPREVLVAALIDDARQLVRDLRGRGWPVEIVAVNEPDLFGVRFEVDLRGIRVPIECEDVS